MAENYSFNKVPPPPNHPTPTPSFRVKVENLHRSDKISWGGAWLLKPPPPPVSTTGHHFSVKPIQIEKIFKNPESRSSLI